MNAASWLDALPAGDRWRARLLRDGPRIATWILVIALAVQAALILTDLAAAGRSGAEREAGDRAHAPHDQRATGAARGCAAAAGGARPCQPPHERFPGVPGAQPRRVHALRAAPRGPGDGDQRHAAG